MQRKYDDDDDAASDTSTERFDRGERVRVDGLRNATVACSGPVHFSYDDDWVGLIFEEPVGKHNGSVGGHQYFKCASMHGLFARSHRLERLDSSGHVTARVKSPYRIQPRRSKSAASNRSELEIEDDMFARAAQAESGGYFEARAGTVRSPHQPDEVSSKLSKFVDSLEHEADQQTVSYASPWIHSSRSPTPTHYAAGLRSGKRAATKSKPYGITLGIGEIDSTNY